jgi:Zn-dependent protease
MQGRITLNPIPHIDIIGTIIFPLLLAIMGQPVFGWAKTVMVNPYNLRNPRRDHMFIAAAGPVSNLIVATFAIIVFLILKKIGLYAMAGGVIDVVAGILFYLIIINVFLALFNLIPVPPLDGSGILEGLLEGEALRIYLSIKPYGFIILVGIIYLGIFKYIAQPVFSVIQAILSL